MILLKMIYSLLMIKRIIFWAAIDSLTSQFLKRIDSLGSRNQLSPRLKSLFLANFLISISWQWEDGDLGLHCVQQEGRH